MQIGHRETHQDKSSDMGRGGGGEPSNSRVSYSCTAGSMHVPTRQCPAAVQAPAAHTLPPSDRQKQRAMLGSELGTGRYARSYPDSQHGQTG